MVRYEIDGNFYETDDKVLIDLCILVKNKSTQNLEFHHDIIRDVFEATVEKDTDTNNLFGYKRVNPIILSDNENKK